MWGYPKFMPACHTYRLHRCVPTEPLGARDRRRQQQLGQWNWGSLGPVYSARSGSYSAPSAWSLRQTAAGFRVPSAAEQFEEKYSWMGTNVLRINGSVNRVLLRLNGGTSFRAARVRRTKGCICVESAPKAEGVIPGAGSVGVQVGLCHP